MCIYLYISRVQVSESVWPFRHPGRIGPSLCQTLPLGRSDTQRGRAFDVPDFAPCLARKVFRITCIIQGLDRG